MIVPIRLKPVELHIHADRRLAFQVLTAFGARQDDGSSSKVLKDENDRKLVEFHSVIPTFGSGQKIYRTVEWVTLREPEEIRFEGVEGPLDLLQDRFVLRDLDGCTLFRYESTIGVKGGIAGWLKGQARALSRRQCNALDAVIVPSTAMQQRLNVTFNEFIVWCFFNIAYVLQVSGIG